MARKREEPMVHKSFTIPEELWERAQDRAGEASLSAIIRALLAGWLAGAFIVSIEGDGPGFDIRAVDATEGASNER